MNDYYTPTLAPLEELKRHNADIAEAAAVCARLEAEIDMFNKYSDCYG